MGDKIENLMDLYNRLDSEDYDKLSDVQKGMKDILNVMLGFEDMQEYEFKYVK